MSKCISVSTQAMATVLVSSYTFFLIFSSVRDVCKTSFANEKKSVPEKGNDKAQVQQRVHFVTTIYLGERHENNAKEKKNIEHFIQLIHNGGLFTSGKHFVLKRTEVE